MPPCCESPQLDFAIRNGDQELRNGTLLTVTLPGGEIDDVGMNEIYYYLTHYPIYDREQRHNFYALARNLSQVGPVWQTKEGNFTRRLSRYAYKELSLKLAPNVLADIGTLARDHSQPADVLIDVSRDLNQSASFFYHSGSCWWGGYSYGLSRCALKTNGGYGLRTFSLLDSSQVTGRAWVQPFKTGERGGLHPTFNTLTPDALAVFNGYGALSGYMPARIMAQLYGWSYKKTGLSISPMYINSNSGYLVGPEDIIQRAPAPLRKRFTRHSELFGDEHIARELAEFLSEDESVMFARLTSARRAA